MTQARSGEMYKYYQDQDVLPTYGAFTSEEALARHQAQRAVVFREKMHLPPALFSQARVLEFGPDSGENSLVFARWGARMTLVEPNPRARPVLENYFKTFGLQDQVEQIIAGDVQSFTTAAPYDFIDAEGFIYTIHPMADWLKVFAAALKTEGIFLISYMEKYGSFMELALKAIFSALARHRDGDPVDVAWTLFETKWNSIPHMRSFKSWVMDVMLNPYVRLRFAYDAKDLCHQAHDHGFTEYSSWPLYRDPLAVYWHKRELSPQELLALGDDHLTRSALSFLLGGKAYVGGDAAAILSLFDSLLDAVDAQIESTDPALPRRCAAILAQLNELVASPQVMFADQTARQQAGELMAGMAHIFTLIADERMDELIAECNRNPAFIRFWGQPNHFAAFIKTGAAG